MPLERHPTIETVDQAVAALNEAATLIQYVARWAMVNRPGLVQWLAVAYSAVDNLVQHLVDVEKVREANRK